MTIDPWVALLALLLASALWLLLRQGGAW